MATRIVVDPMTRIEGHLRIEAETDNGMINDAYASCTMWRGVSIDWKNVGKWTTPSVLCFGSGASFRCSRRDHASVPSEPTSRCAMLKPPPLPPSP